MKVFLQSLTIILMSVGRLAATSFSLAHNHSHTLYSTMYSEVSVEYLWETDDRQ